MPVQYLGECNPTTRLSLPLFAEKVSAGFPSPAQDYLERELDLNELCVLHPAATYLVIAQGDSMQGAGIYEGDVLIVDRSITPAHGYVVIAELDGEFTVKRLELQPAPRLVPCNPKYPAIELAAGAELEIKGVVLHSIRNHCLGQGKA